MIDARDVPVRSEQTRDAGARYEFLRQAPVQRRQPDRVVLHRFGGDAACAEPDHAPERGLGRDADHQAPRVALFDHRLHAHAFDSGFGPYASNALHQRFVLALQGVFAANVEAYAVDLGAMCNVARENPDGHRKSDLPRDGARLLRGAADSCLRDRYSEAAKQTGRLVFVQLRPPVLPRLPSYRQRCVQIRPRARGERRGNLEQQILGHAVLGQRAEGRYRVLGRAKRRQAGLRGQSAAGAYVALAQPARENRFLTVFGAFDDGPGRRVGIQDLLWTEQREYAIDAIVRENGYKRAREPFGARIAEQIDRIASRPVCRQAGIESRERMRRQLRDVHAGFGSVIGGHHARSAAVADDGEPVAPREYTGADQLLGREQFGVGSDANRATSAQHRVECGVLAVRKIRVVGIDRFARCGSGRQTAATGLEHDDGFGARRGAQTGYEASRVADAFKVDENTARVRIVDQVVQYFSYVQVDPGPHGDHI